MLYLGIIIDKKIGFSIQKRNVLQNKQLTSIC